MAEEVKLDKSKKYEVKDEKGEWHRAKIDIFGQKMREAYSAPRVLIAFLVFFAVVGATNELSPLLRIGIALVAVLVIRYFILNILLDDEELNTIREIKKDVK